MRRKLIVFFLFVLMVLGIGLLVAANITCPIDDTSAYFTGTIKSDAKTGKQLWLYQCYIYGHKFWVVQ